jgi:hypothetical protein
MARFKFSECAPYHSDKGQMWEAFIRNFAAAMSTREVAEDSLEDTLYGVDTSAVIGGSMSATLVKSTGMACGRMAT